MTGVLPVRAQAPLPSDLVTPRTVPLLGDTYPESVR
jgi:hypothetical protein